MYVYEEFEKGLFTVGYYQPNDDWCPEGDYATQEEAARRVRFLNGGGYHAAPEQPAFLTLEARYYARAGDATDHTWLVNPARVLAVEVTRNFLLVHLAEGDVLQVSHQPSREALLGLARIGGAG